MAAPKTILITAGFGNIGPGLISLLLSHAGSPNIVLPTTNIENVMTKNAEAIARDASRKLVLEQGSIRDPIWFEDILVKHQVEAVFLCITGVDEMFTTLNCLDAISKAGTVKKVVHLSIVGRFASQTDGDDIFGGRGYPHIFSKVVVERRLLYGNFPFAWTVLGPAFFFTNDYRLKYPITSMGVYPEPDLSKGGSKIDVADIALAAANALMDSRGKWNSRKVMLGSNHSYTTSEAAEIWSKALQKPLNTIPANQDVFNQFEQNLRQTLGPSMDGLAFARDLRLLYEYYTVKGVSIDDEEYKDQVELLGREPNDYGAWVKKVAASWL